MILDSTLVVFLRQVIITAISPNQTRFQINYNIRKQHSCDLHKT